MVSGAKSYLANLGIGGLLFAIKTKLTGRGGLFEFRSAEVRHPIYLRIPSSDMPTYQQVFVNREYDFAVERQPQVIIDAGANIGLASIFFASRYPMATIIAIEPEKGNFDLLKKNVAPYPNVVAVNAALWHKNEEINLVDPGLGNWGFMTETVGAPSNLKVASRHMVKAVTVDQILSQYSLANVDILKIDIEGAEREVFTDTSAWIHKVDAIIIELHERMKPGCNRSFYRGSDGFDLEWMQGENIYLSRQGNLLKPRVD